MNSSEVGTTPEPVMSFGTAAIAVSMSGKGINRATEYLGLGRSLSVILVAMPSVPSDPTISV